MIKERIPSPLIYNENRFREMTKNRKNIQRSKSLLQNRKIKKSPHLEENVEREAEEMTEELQMLSVKRPTRWNNIIYDNIAEEISNKGKMKLKVPKLISKEQSRNHELVFGGITSPLLDSGKVKFEDENYAKNKQFDTFNQIAELNSKMEEISNLKDATFSEKKKKHLYKYSLSKNHHNYNKKQQNVKNNEQAQDDKEFQNLLENLFSRNSPSKKNIISESQSYKVLPKSLVLQPTSSRLSVKNSAQGNTQFRARKYFKKKNNSPKKEHDKNIDQSCKKIDLLKDFEDLKGPQRAQSELILESKLFPSIFLRQPTVQEKQELLAKQFNNQKIEEDNKLKLNLSVDSKKSREEDPIKNELNASESKEEENKKERTKSENELNDSSKVKDLYYQQIIAKIEAVKKANKGRSSVFLGTPSVSLQNKSERRASYRTPPSGHFHLRIPNFHKHNPSFEKGLDQSPAPADKKSNSQNKGPVLIQFTEIKPLLHSLSSPIKEEVSFRVRNADIQEKFELDASSTISLQDEEEQSNKWSDHLAEIESSPKFEGLNEFKFENRMKLLKDNAENKRIKMKLAKERSENEFRKKQKKRIMQMISRSSSYKQLVQTVFTKYKERKRFMKQWINILIMFLVIQDLYYETKDGIRNKVINEKKYTISIQKAWISYKHRKRINQLSINGKKMLSLLMFNLRMKKYFRRKRKSSEAFLTFLAKRRRATNLQKIIFYYKRKAKRVIHGIQESYKINQEYRNQISSFLNYFMIKSSSQATFFKAFISQNMQIEHHLQHFLSHKPFCNCRNCLHAYYEKKKKHKSPKMRKSNLQIAIQSTNQEQTKKTDPITMKIPEKSNQSIKSTKSTKVAQVTKLKKLDEIIKLNKLNKLNKEETEYEKRNSAFESAITEREEEKCKNELIRKSASEVKLKPQFKSKFFHSDQAK